MEKGYENNMVISRLLKNGNTDVFEYLYTTYYSSLNRFAFHIVMCDNSHDIVQEVFTKLWINRKNIADDLNVKSYLYASVKNGALNYLKHLNIVDDKKSKIIESTLFINDSWNDDEQENEILFDRVLELINNLPAQQQKVIKLKFEGKSYKDISEELDISIKTVNNHIVKAYSFIRDILLILFFLIFLNFL